MAINPVSLAVAAVMTGVNLLVNAMRTIEGPRLNDTSPVVADYGTPLNYFVGRRLLACPSFFAKPIREVRQEHKGKGGKQVQYTGFATWASHICDHEIKAVLKIWFDNHLVFDATGSEDQIYPLGGDYEVEAAIRIYYGTETQEADPDMLAYIEARDGAGTCPAYRPTSYVYFQDVPVEKIGNRFPTVTMLVDSAIGLGSPSATVVIDFENQAYSINGESVTLGEIAEDSEFDPFDPGDALVEGGLRAYVDWPTVTDQQIEFFTSLAASDALAAGGSTVTAEFEFTYSSEDEEQAYLYTRFSNSENMRALKLEKIEGFGDIYPAIEASWPPSESDVVEFDAQISGGRHTATVTSDSGGLSATLPVGSESIPAAPAFAPQGFQFTLGATAAFNGSSEIILHKITITTTGGT